MNLSRFRPTSQSMPLWLQQVLDRLMTNLSLLLGWQLDSVENLAGLATVDDTTIPDGSKKVVRTLWDTFTLDKSSTDVVNGITVLATASGAGRWVRDQLPNAAWQAQTSWYIDAVAGDDENTGLTNVSPIATWGEFIRRVGQPFVVKQDTTITILSDIPANDPVSIMTMTLSGVLTIQGDRTVVQSSEVTGWQFNAAGNQEPQVSIDGFDAAGNEGALLRFPDAFAPGEDAYAWVQEDLGNGVGGLFRCSHPSADNSIQFPGVTIVAPTDPVEVVSIPTVRAHAFTSDSEGDQLLTTLCLKTLTMEPEANSFVALNGQSFCSIFVSACNISALSCDSGWNVINGTTSANAFFSVPVSLYGCLFDAINIRQQALCFGVHCTGYLSAENYWNVQSPGFGAFCDILIDSHGLLQTIGGYTYGSIDTIVVYRGKFDTNSVSASTPVNVTVQGKSIPYGSYMTAGDTSGLSPRYPDETVGLPQVYTTFGTITAGGGNQFVLPDGSEQVNAGTTVPDLSVVVAKRGFLRNLKVFLDQDPTSAITFTVWRVPAGGTASAATTLTCQVAAGGPGPWFNEDITNDVFVEPGDRLVLQHNQAGGGTATKVSAVYEIS